MHRRPVKALTIDGPTTRDIDDAIWVAPHEEGGWEVDVSISDVATEVPIGSDADRVARARVETRYLRNDTQPMLPKILSENDLSLWPHLPRRAVTVRIHLQADYEVVASSVFLSDLTSAAKLSYADVPKILVSKDNRFHEVIRNANQAAQALGLKRRAAGALAYLDYDQGWITSEEGYVRTVTSPNETRGYSIIQELMILANSELARFAIQNEVPILFRSHTVHPSAPPREDIQAELQDLPSQPLTVIETVRTRTKMLLNRARYSSSVEGHFGLNLPVYTHLTSPIRRYADLINQRQIVAHLIGKTLPYSQVDLQDLERRINTTIETYRQSRADAFKERANNTALRQIERSDIRKLSDRDFERVVKVSCRSGAELPENVGAVFVERLQNGTLSPLCQTIVFLEAPHTPTWMNLRRQITEALASNPANAVTILTQASSIGGWTAPSFTVTEAGAEHEKRFSAVGTLVFPDRTVVSEAFEARTAKLAKQRAAVGLLAVLAERVRPKFDATDRAVDTGSGNPIAALQERAQALRAPAPSYTYSHSGPSHLPTFRCECTFGAAKAEGTGKTKQDAKRDAAEKLLAKLGPTLSRRELPAS